MSIILFSPVGGTDPISLNNWYDGALLHICRQYKPDRVILYMSREILENHYKDNRYLYCLDKLAQMQSRKMEYQIIERPNLKKVYDFDFFYQDFKKIIDRIVQVKRKEDQILLNISSGTPAMKSGLAVLQTIEEYPCKLIQVTTPVKSMNEHTHKGYDVETLWEGDEDNAVPFVNRCLEIQCPTLSTIKQQEIIKKHVNSYDYRGALQVADSLPTEVTASYYSLLEAACYRIQMDLPSMRKKISPDMYRKFIPVQSGDLCPDVEYALGVQIKLKRKEYADFMRSLTPLIVDMLEKILKCQCNIDVSEYCEIRHGIRRWSESKLAHSDLLTVLEAEYQERAEGRSNRVFSFGPVYSDHLCILIYHYSVNESMKRLIQELRGVERKIRNMAAHQMVAITDEVILQQSGFRASQIMKKVRQLFHFVGIKLPKDLWDSYEAMNRMICSCI